MRKPKLHLSSTLNNDGCVLVGIYGLWMVNEKVGGFSLAGKLR